MTELQMAHDRRFQAVLTNGSPVCPAGTDIAEADGGGTGCRCRITHDNILSVENPHTLGRYCFNAQGYQECPTWRSDKEATQEGRDLSGEMKRMVGN